MNKVLQNINSIFELSDDELSALTENLVPLEIKAGDYYLREGQVANSIAFVEKGCLRLFYDSNEKESCNDFFFENSLVGSLASFFSQSPSMANIVALENCILLKLSYDAVTKLIHHSPKFRNLANFILAEQLTRSEIREANLLKLTPYDRYRQLLENHPKLFKRIPLLYIASYLNISPETLSRYRNKKDV